MIPRLSTSAYYLGQCHQVLGAVKMPGNTSRRHFYRFARPSWPVVTGDLSLRMVGNRLCLVIRVSVWGNDGTRRDFHHILSIRYRRLFTQFPPQADKMRVNEPGALSYLVSCCLRLILLFPYLNEPPHRLFRKPVFRNHMTSFSYR